MKKRFSQLSALVLSLTLALSLTFPARTAEDAGLSSAVMRQEWIDAHPSETAAFDPYAYFSEHPSPYASPQEFMEAMNITPETFEAKMLSAWVSEQIAAAETRRQFDEFIAAHPEKAGSFDAEKHFSEMYPWYGSSEEYKFEMGLTQAEFERQMMYDWLYNHQQLEMYRQELDEYLSAHPKASFDLELYFAQEYPWYSNPEEYMADVGGPWERFEALMISEWLQAQRAEEERQKAAQAWIDAHPEEYAVFDPCAYFAKEYFWIDSPEKFMEDKGLTQEEFEQEMLEEWLQDQLEAEEKEREIAQFKAEYPEECAAFDAFAYFDSLNYDWYDSPQEYMEGMGLTEEEFYQKMFLDWIWSVQIMAEDKERFGGSAKGVNVMVNGQCIQFPDVRPEIKNNRTMAPLAAVMEHLGAQVSYDAASNTVLVSMDGLSFMHTIGSDLLALSDGSRLQMDVPSYGKDGRTMVPITFFAQQFGYEVSWDKNYQTAVLSDWQKLKESIDREFTLYNRALYAGSGAGIVTEGQPAELVLDMDLDFTLFDSLNGDQRLSTKLTGSVVYDSKAIQLHFSGDLSPLLDIVNSISTLGETHWNQYRAALSHFSLDAIVNLEAGTVYLRCPALAAINPDLKDSDSWIALPAAPSELPLNLFAAASVGELALRQTGSRSPFWDWNDAASFAGLLNNYLGDEQFTKSGNSYTAALNRWDTDGWWYDGSCSGTVKITPSGSRSCTYSLDLQASGNNMLFDLDMSGSSGKTAVELSFHMKNAFKLTVKGNSRVSASKQQSLFPSDAPYAGAVK